MTKLHEKDTSGKFINHKRLYTLKEAAGYLGRSVWSMREIIWAGEIPVVRQNGGRKIYLDVLDLNVFIDKNKGQYL